MKYMYLQMHDNFGRKFELHSHKFDWCADVSILELYMLICSNQRQPTGFCSGNTNLIEQVFNM